MKRAYARSISALALISLALGACSALATEPPPSAVPTVVPTQGPPDLTGKTVKIYGLADRSGPYAASSASLVIGAEDLITWVNESGGVFGAKLELIFEDTAGKVDNAVAIYDRITSEDPNVLLMVMLSSPDQEALRDRVAEDQIPVMAMAPSAPALYGAKEDWQFSVFNLYPDQLAHFLDYLVENWETVRPTGAGDQVKLAHLSWPGAFGQAALTDELRAYAEGLGAEIVDEEQFELAPTADTTAAILNAQAAGANVIWTNTLAFGPAALLNDLNELGVRDQFVVGGAMMAMDLATYAFLSDPQNAYGMYASYPFAWWSDTDNPGVQWAKEICERYERGTSDESVGRMSVEASIDIGLEALRRAILTVGYEKLTGRAVFNELTQLKDYPALGGVTTVDFTNGNRSGHLIQLRQIQGGPDKFMAIEEGFVPAPGLMPVQ